MSKKSVEQQDSDTAIVAAGFRAVAHRDFPHSQCGADNLAEKFLPPFQRFLIKSKIIRNLGVKRHNKFTPGGYAYVLARTVFFDQVFLEAIESGTKQIVFLGAGYDSRAYRFRSLCTDCKIIELDVRTTQEEKKHCLEKADIKLPPNITFAAINFNQQSLSEVLLDAGFDPRESSLFLWEGVSMYLDESAVDSTLQFVSNCQQKNSQIAFDYIASLSPDQAHRHYGVTTWQDTWRRFRQAEPFTYTINENQLESFLRDRNLTMKNHWLSEDIENRFLTIEEKEDLGKVAGWFRFVVATSISPLVV